MSKNTGARAPYRTLAGLFCTALLAGLACGSGDSAPEASAPERGAAAPAGSAAPERSAEPGGGEAEVSRGQLPENFPSDLPVYPGSESGSAIGIPGAALMATFSTDDSVEDVSDYLEGELPRSGWSVTDQGEGSIEATKDSRKARFRISAAEAGGATIAVSVTGS